MSRTKSQLAGLIAIASVASVGCVPAEDKCDAATVQSVQLAATLIPDGVHNIFYLTTPTTARSACDAHYHLTFHWAAAARAATDTTLPPINGLDHGFHVAADTIWWTHDAPARTAESFVDWLIDFVDHDAVATSPQSQYYIRLGLTSGTLADSVAVSGSISYYPQ